MIRRALILSIPLAIVAALSSAAKAAPVEATQPSGHAATGRTPRVAYFEVSDDDQLGVIVPNALGTDTGAAALPLATIFGERERFEVKGALKTKTRHPLPASATGIWKATTSLTWTVTFNRLARRPR